MLVLDLLKVPNKKRAHGFTKHVAVAGDPRCGQAMVAAPSFIGTVEVDSFTASKAHVTCQRCLKLVLKDLFRAGLA